MTYSRSEAFTEELLIGSLSSIPRWRFARKLEGLGEEPITRRVPDAMESFIRSSSEIITGEYCC